MDWILLSDKCNSCKLTNLISLQLINNSLLHLNSNSIRNLPSLTHLYLRDNRLTEVPTQYLILNCHLFLE
jgi:Leucine-rich repeat (LRR) protein